VKFRGEKQDLQDMVGNLLDNASKWAKSKVTVCVTVQPPTKQSTSEQLLITVNDDGPGLPPEELETVIKRGKRLDENKPGSGLGLSIVSDLSEMYDGSFKLDNVPSGGLSAQLLLPAT
jgi:signal transduction histidine kinase